MKKFNDFSNWLNMQFQKGIQPKGAALCFNLYENEESYSFQLIASEYFDEDDSDWPCREVYTSGENIFSIDRNPDIKEWKDGLKFAAGFVYEYLKTGNYTEFMKTYEAVAIGFVDGDIVVLSKKDEILNNAVSDYLKLY